MKNIKFIAIIQLLFFLLLGCSLNPDYSAVDRQGEIIEVDKGKERILVDDKKNGQIWVDISKLSDKDKFHKPLEVIVWLDGDVIDGEPQVGIAKRVDVVK
ncbi:hypothetical protein DFP93_11641 [Aneurinibacillus soli]|uniref:Uncharacterized protein n=1 Tax=Aneurinibacillus soli TaxID=1500254 RepID=A0A0U5BF56_9BACL|nr:hypothetical protein [Aneurinibacillus soli]PYE59674.1 hypothetical protein DFP93_11641 [Aneurinibacillus soli]BAU29325.1 hypothetical protein CB4_03512 [Aneurinibacillus soli]